MSDDELPNFEIKLNFNEVHTTKEPPRKKKRMESPFATLNETQLNELVEGARAKSTIYSTTHAVKVFTGKLIFKIFQPTFYS